MSFERPMPIRVVRNNKMSTIKYNSAATNKQAFLIGLSNPIRVGVCVYCTETSSAWSTGLAECLVFCTSSTVHVQY